MSCEKMVRHRSCTIVNDRQARFIGLNAFQIAARKIAV